jgi:hypothetical protein
VVIDVVGKNDKRGDLLFLVCFSESLRLPTIIIVPPTAAIVDK